VQILLLMGSSLQQRAESSDERQRQALLLALSESSGTAQEREILDVIADIVVTRFNGRSIRKLCAMGGITLDEFT
jgi:hypothetical protein